MVDETRRQRLAARARILKALAHPSRLLVVEELARGERCVRDLASLVGADLSTVSRHLSVLREAGIVHGRKRGLQILYALRIPCALDFLACAERVLASVAEETARLARPAREGAAASERSADELG